MADSEDLTDRDIKAAQLWNGRALDYVIETPSFRHEIQMSQDFDNNSQRLRSARRIDNGGGRGSTKNCAVGGYNGDTSRSRPRRPSDGISLRKQVTGEIFGFDDDSEQPSFVMADNSAAVRPTFTSLPAESRETTGRVEYQTALLRPGAYNSREERAQRKGILTPLEENRRTPEYTSSDSEAGMMDDDSLESMPSDEEETNPVSIIDRSFRSVSLASFASFGAGAGADEPKKRCAIGMISIILALLIAAIVCGVIFGKKKSNISPERPIESWIDIVNFCDGQEGTLTLDNLPPNAQAQYHLYRNQLNQNIQTLSCCDLNICSAQSLALASMALRGLDLSVPQVVVRYAFSSTFFATKGPGWFNSSGWIDNEDICSWHGIGCSADSGEIVELLLDRNNLQGSMADEIYLVETLKVLSLFGNKVLGGLSPMIANLSNLEELFLQGVLTKHPLPGEIMQLTNLKILYLDNFIGGEIPTEIGLMTSLEALDLTRVEQGTIPKEIAKLSSLRQLVLDGSFIGSFPSEIWLLPSLQYLDITPIRSILEESVIPKFSFENNTSWTHIQVTDSHIIGSIPTSIGNLRGLKQLSLKGNNLDGTIPSELGLCSDLVDIFLFSNDLRGTIPTELSHLKSIEALDFKENQLTGQLPSQLGELTSLQVLILSGNRLRLTSIPESFVSLKMLTILDLGVQSDSFDGTVPSVICEIAGLDTFMLTCPVNADISPCSKSCCSCS